MKRWLIGLAWLALLSGCGPAPVESPAAAAVAQELRFATHWQRLDQLFINQGGRVIDLGSEGSISTSEGQAYSLFFALVANQPERFATILRWTEANLADGDLTARLPAWLWGQHSATEDWGILDQNAASDADVWMAYTLLEAGAAWQQPRYTALGKLLAARIIREETVVWQQQRVLLPGPQGFYRGDQEPIILNPSYFSLALFEGLASHTGDPRWQAIYASSKQLLERYSESGYVADWWRLNVDGGVDEDYEPMADYDAIRTYLWFAFEADRKHSRLYQLYQGMYQFTAAQGAPAQTVRWQSGEVDSEAGVGPLGFSIVIAPYLKLFDPALAQLQYERLLASPVERYQQRYYDTMLMLFGLGYQQGCYQFTAEGRLVLSWQHEICTL